MADPRRPWRKLYNTRRWQRLRLAQLREEPLCLMCQEAGRATPATVVDHRIAHKGDEALFFDEGNLQSLCKTHHDASKQRAEQRGIDEIGCDESGWPRDPGHHWST